MWSLLARTLLVFVAWGVLFAVALAAGLPRQGAELASTLGAGLTLVVRGLVSRPTRAHRVSTAGGADRRVGLQRR